MTSSSFGAVVRAAAAVGVALVWVNAVWAQVPLIECPGDLTRMSVDRLVSDLEKMIRDYPDEPGIHHQLARVHLTAFVERKPTLAACSTGLALTVPTARGTLPIIRTGLPWGPEVPIKDDWRPRRPEDDDTREGVRAREQLKKSIQRYEEAIAKTRARDGEYVHGSRWLGYGWALQQDGGPTDQVMSAYRKATALAWPEEQKRNLLPPPIPIRKDVPGTFTSPDILRITETVTRWLIPLLDPISNAGEIATLKERAAALAKERKARTK